MMAEPTGSARLHEERAAPPLANQGGSVEEAWNRPWTIEVRSTPEGGYRARIIELEGCSARGDTRAAAIDNLQAQFQTWFAQTSAHDRDFQLPIADREFSGRFSIRIPPSVHEALVLLAEREGISLNALISNTLSWRVGYSGFLAGAVRDIRLGDVELVVSLTDPSSIHEAKIFARELERHRAFDTAFLVRALLADRILNLHDEHEASRHLGATAQAAARADRLDLAEAFWRESLALDADNPLSISAFANFLFDQRRWGDALPYLRKSRDAWALVNASWSSLYLALARHPVSAGDPLVTGLLDALKDIAYENGRVGHRRTWIANVRKLSRLEILPAETISNLVTYTQTYSRWHPIGLQELVSPAEASPT